MKIKSFISMAILTIGVTNIAFGQTPDENSRINPNYMSRTVANGETAGRTITINSEKRTFEPVTYFISPANCNNSTNTVTRNIQVNTDTKFEYLVKHDLARDGGTPGNYSISPDIFDRTLKPNNRYTLTLQCNNGSGGGEIIFY